MMDRPKVYIETSVVSYQTAWLSRDILVAAHQQITHQWWREILPRVQSYISSFVLDESSRGDVQAAGRRLDALEGMTILEVNDLVAHLARRYCKVLQLPQRSEADASHLAIASVYQMDYLLSWNCRHISNGRVRKLVSLINRDLGLLSPEICTPEELLEV